MNLPEDKEEETSPAMPGIETTSSLKRCHESGEGESKREGDSNSNSNSNTRGRNNKSAKLFNEYLSKPSGNAIKVQVLLQFLSWCDELESASNSSSCNNNSSCSSKGGVEKQAIEMEEGEEEEEVSPPGDTKGDKEASNGLLIEELVKRMGDRFIPTQADELYKKIDIHKPPDWLTNMLKDERVKSKICQLHDAHPNSRFLSFCLKLMDKRV